MASENLKVLFLTHSFPRFEGDGAGSFLLRLAAALGKEGVEVQVVAPATAGVVDSARLNGTGVDRFHYAPRRFETLAYGGNMAEQVRDSWSARFTMIGFLGAEFRSAVRARRAMQPDIVHAHWWFPSGLVGTWLSKLSHTPLVTTLHGTDVRMARSISMSRPAFRHVLQHSAAVTAVSRWLAHEAQSLVSAPPAVVAPMPVGTELFSPGAGARSARFCSSADSRSRKDSTSCCGRSPFFPLTFRSTSLGKGRSATRCRTSSGSSVSRPGSAGTALSRNRRSWISIAPRRRS